jgi:predicted MFS family arabinose efflux permease
VTGAAGEDPAAASPGSSGRPEKEEPATGASSSPSVLRVLGSRRFLPFFLGSVLSNVGTWFQNIAAGLLIYQITGSTLLVGTVHFAQFIGAFVLAPWAGGAADRFDRRRLLAVTQLVAGLTAAVLALLTWLGLVTAPLVIGLSFVLGLSLAFMVPALLSLVPLLVEARDLDAAISLNSITFNLARAVGPFLGALVAERFGYGAAFGMNALSFLAFAAALTFLVHPHPQERTTGPRPRLRLAIADVRREPVWVALLVVVAAISFTADPILTLAPELARDVFGGTDLDAGLLVGAFGTGAVITALTLTGWLRARRNALPGALLTQAAGMLVVAVAGHLWVALAGMLVSGGGYLAAVTRATTRLQTEVPDALLGRVMALWSVCFVGSRPFAALLDGAVAEVAGARVAAATMAVPSIVVALWCARILRGPEQPATERDAGSPGVG